MQMKRRHWFYILFGVSVLIRLWFSFSMELIPGMNGGYYPVQVRSILENGQLGFPDFPLYFYVLALFSKLFSLFGVEMTGDDLIVLIKIVEAIALPLLLWPLYKMDLKLKWSVQCILGVFLVFGTGSLMMFGDFQKNAFALPFIWFFIWKFRDYLLHENRKDLFQSLVFLLIVGLTHFGAFSVSVVFLMSGLLFKFRKKALVPMLLAMSGLIALSYLFDAKRTMRLFESLASIFIRSNGKGPGGFFINPPDIAAILLMIFLMIVFIRNRKAIVNHHRKVFLYASLLTGVLFSFPVFAQDFYMRLGLMAGIFQVLVFVELFPYMNIRFSGIVQGTMILIVIVGIPMMVYMKQPVISIAQKHQLLRIAEVLQKENGTKIIVTRHGLEWWTNWFTRIPVAQDRSMDASLFAEYDRVYLLKMKSDQHGPPMGMKNEEEPKFTVTDTLYNEEGASLVELAKK
jgi:hypothetical protein